MKYSFTKLLVPVAAMLLLVACSKDEDSTPVVTPVAKAGSFVRTIGNSYTLTQTQVIDGTVSTITDGYPEFAQYQSGLSLMLGMVINKDITITKLEYYTTDADGSIIKASGVVAWPTEVESDSTYDRIVLVSHGTCDIDKAPSLQQMPVEIAPVFNTLRNQIVILPDYIGYGSSQTADLAHPYLRSDLTGTTVADMLKATEEYIAKYKHFHSSHDVDSLQLCGYSQGGHGTIATLFELQKRGYTDRIHRVDAGAGPLDLLAIWNLFMEQQYGSYEHMGYGPYMIRGMFYGNEQDVDYHNIYADELFQPDSNGVVRYNLFTTTMLDTWHKQLGTDITKVLHPDFFTTEKNADILKLYALMQDNSLVDYSTPANPETITFYHGEQDDQVPYVCSVNAHNKWSGSKLVNLELTPDNHSIGGIEFYLRLLDDNQCTIWGSLYTLLQPFVAEL